MRHREIVFLLDFDYVKNSAIGARDCAEELHPSVFYHAAVDSLGILGQVGEGIEGITTIMAPESDPI